MKNPVSDSIIRGVKEMETGGHNDRLIRSNIINYRIVDQDTLSDYVSDDWAVENYWPEADEKGMIIPWRTGFVGSFKLNPEGGKYASTGMSWPVRENDWGFRVVRNR